MFPQTNENSEELLNILYKNIKKKDHIALLQGENGRHFIKKRLNKQGYNVNLIECYKRVLKVDINKELKKWHLYGINTFVITNGETLIKLKSMVCNNLQMQWLLTCNIFVVGERLFILAKKLGWTKIIMSHYANNHVLIEIIKKTAGKINSFGRRKRI